MGSYDQSPDHCNNTVTKLLLEVTTSTLANVTSDDLKNLMYFCGKGYDAEASEEYSKPMVWIGIYIAIASCVCIIAMVADFWHSVCNHIHQMPSNYFSLNVASMTVITIAMKLTVDMSGSMPGNLDQAAKIGSIAFMCTMMAILNPSLASMNNKTLLANIIGLAILVITISVNILVEINTGVINNRGTRHLEQGKFTVVYIKYSYEYATMASIYVAFMLFLLLISISAAIIIPSIKKVLEFKYQVRRKALIDEQQQDTRRISTVKELREHVNRYWIMAKTGSPHFVMASNILSYSSLCICASGMYIQGSALGSLYVNRAVYGKYESEYRWSIGVILVTQNFGNIIGFVIVLLRCTKSMIFKAESWQLAGMFSLRKKDKYWTEVLCEWKGSHVGFLSSFPRSSRIFVHFMKECVLSLCIGLQNIFLVLYKLLGFSSTVFLQVIMLIPKILGSLDRLEVSRNDDINRDLRSYVLQLEDEVQLSQSAVEYFASSMNILIVKTYKEQSNNLLDLLRKNSNGFIGVENFDDVDQNFGFPLSVELNSWSVPVVTLTCIANVVPGVSKEQVDSLFKGVDEALFYIYHVDESFNDAHEYLNVRKITMTLWYEIRNKCKWLENSTERGAFGEIPIDILSSFAAKADAILGQIGDITIIKEQMINFPYKLIAAHSMHRISHSILSKYADHEIQTNERFFEFLSSMIADILVACFSNLPQVIMMKCHSDEIEKREASVEAATKLLARSTEIIRNLETRELPNMDKEKRACIHQWRLHLKQSVTSNEIR